MTIKLVNHHQQLPQQHHPLVPCNSVTSSSSGISSGSASSTRSSSSCCSVTSDTDASNDTGSFGQGYESSESSSALDEIRNLVLTDALIPGKVVQMTSFPDADAPGGQRRMVLVKWCNHPALTWIDYDAAREKYPDIILDYYEALLVFDS